MAALAAVLAASPGTALDPTKPLNQYRLKTWRQEDGLPQASVWGLTQTRDGYLWFGSFEGLVRFDGVRFTVFDEHNTPGILAGYVYTLLEGRDGSLWIGTDGGGLSRHRDGTFTATTSRDGLASDRILTLAESAGGVLWIGTDGNGLARLEDGRLRTYTTRDGLAGDTISALLAGRGGDLWIGTDGGGLGRFRNGRFETYTTRDGLPGDYVYALLEDRGGSLWIGTYGGGLARLRNGAFTTWSTAEGLAGDNVVSLAEAADGSLWIGSYGGGLTRLQEGEISRLTAADGLPSDRIWSVFEDREGSVWLGTEGGGLHRLSDSLFTSFTAADALAHDGVMTVYEDREGRLWAGTVLGVSYLEDGEWRTLTRRDGLPGDAVQAIHQGPDGDLWLGTGNGVARWDDGEIVTYSIADGLSHYYVMVIDEDHEGNILIGTYGGLDRVRAGVIRPFLSTAEGLPDNVVRGLARGRDGTLWIGTDQGLAGFKDGAVIVDDLAGEFVWALYEDSAGSLWIGTRDRGLARLRDGKLTHYAISDGLWSEAVYQILEDDAGNFWMSGSKGVFRVHRSELESFAAGRIDAVTSIAYGPRDGLPNTEFSGGNQPAGWKARDGRLWFPTAGGLAVVDPSDLHDAPAPPPVVLEEALFDGRSLALDAALELAPGKGNLALRYTGLSFHDSEKIEFQYQLEGFDDAWIVADQRRQAFYTNLAPGSYRFRVTARSGPGDAWNEEAAELQFRLLPHFYQTVPFYGLCVLMILLGGWGLNHLRVRQLVRSNVALEDQVAARNAELVQQKDRLLEMLEERDRLILELEERHAEMERFAYTVSHDLKNPLFTIRGFAGHLEESLSKQATERAAGEVREIKEAAEVMGRLLADLLELPKLGWIKEPPRETALFDLAQEALALLRARTAERPIEVDISPELPVVYVDRQRILELLQILLDNACKYMGSTRGPRVEIGVGGEGEETILHVRDNGMGIDPRYHEKIFRIFEQLDGTSDGTGIGLALAKRIVKIHGGRIWVESEGEGHGSTFYFTLSDPRRES